MEEKDKVYKIEKVQKTMIEREKICQITRSIKIRNKLFGRTVPPNKLHRGGTVPPNKLHHGGTVPPNKLLFGGTLFPRNHHTLSILRLG